MALAKPAAAEITALIQRQGFERVVRRQGNGNASTSHVIPCPAPAIVQTAIRDGTIMIAATTRRLKDGPASVPTDPRLHTPLHFFYTLFFKVEPGDKSMSQIHTIGEYFRLLEQALPATTTECVSKEHPMCPSQGIGHAGFADIGTSARPKISLCPVFFEQSADRRARTIVHELAHARLGIEHKGGKFLQFGCGETPVKTFDEAIGNAYVYDIFAACMHASAAR